MGRVLGGSGQLPLGGGKAFVAHGGHALRIDDNLVAGDKIHVDFSHVAPFDELSCALHPITGWLTSMKVEEPWEQYPWNGNVFLDYTTPFGSPYSIGGQSFTGIVGLSACSDLSGDVITWTSPVSSVEFDGIDTTNGHFGWLFNDFGAAVTSGATTFALTHTATTYGAWSFFSDQFRAPAATLSVGASIATATTAENAVGMTLPSDVSAGTFLLVTSACEKDILGSGVENSSTKRPFVHVNWGVDDLAFT